MEESFVRIRLIFVESDFTLLGLSSLLFDLDRVVSQVNAMGSGRFLYHEYRRERRSIVRYFERHSEPRKRAIERLAFESIRVERLTLASPLEVVLSMFTPSGIKNSVITLTHHVLAYLLIDLRRKKLEYENEILRQKVIRESLKTFAEAIKLEDKIKDPSQRERFVRDFASSIAPFTDGTYPKIDGIFVEGVEVASFPPPSPQ